MTAKPGANGEPTARITLLEVLLHRPFLILWLAMLISTTGTFLFLLIVAGKVFEETRSSLHASLVYGAQWLLPVLFASVTNRLYQRVRPRHALVAAEVLSMLTTMGVALVIDASYPVVLVLMTLRGYFSSTVMVGRTISLKQNVAPRYLEKASSIFGTSFYLSIGLAGLCGSALVERLSLFEIAVIDSMTFLVAAGLYFTLPSKPANPPSRRGLWQAAFAVFRDHRIVGYHALYLFVLVGVFQGFHTVARTIIPMQHLELGVPGTTHLLLVTCGAIIAGALFVFRFMTDRASSRYRPLVLTTLTAIAMVLPALVDTPWVCFALYFVFMFLYELASTTVRNVVMVATPHESIGTITAFTHSVSTAIMMVMVVLVGSGIDTAGIVTVTVILAVVAVVPAALIAFRHERAIQSR